MKNLEVTGFTQLSAEDMQNLNGGQLFTGLLATVEGVVNTAIGTVEGLLNPLAALLDSLVGSLPIGIGIGGL